MYPKKKIHPDYLQINWDMKNNFIRTEACFIFFFFHFKLFLLSFRWLSKNVYVSMYRHAYWRRAITNSENSRINSPALIILIRHFNYFPQWWIFPLINQERIFFFSRKNVLLPILLKRHCVFQFSFFLLDSRVNSRDPWAKLWIYIYLILMSTLFKRGW